VVEIAGADALAGLEALLRWRNPDRGLLTPENFLPFIEHSPLVEEVGEWVVDEVCRQLAQWRLRSFSPRVSFNVPARQLKRLGFAELVIATADRLGADPRQLAVEVTENTPVDLEDVLPTLSALCEAGVVLALDDFGTGYSSLARLRTMPFSLLKTDRTFMAGIPGDEIAEELLEGIISLGNTLGLRVIVEGVETAEQARELQRLRCRYAQGFHLGGPVPAAEIERRWGHGGPTSPRSSQASRASSRG
jgi:EAL domain-containing protein (putative c-di-GMP-specific phosphodiesterase class I)